METYPEYAKFCDPERYVKMYFVAKLNKKPSKFGVFTDSLQFGSNPTTTGVNNGLFLTFSMEESETLEVRTGLSYSSIENARMNLTAESSQKTFDQVRQDAGETWNKMLNRIVVQGGEEKDKVKFYTGAISCLAGKRAGQ